MTVFATLNCFDNVLFQIFPFQKHSDRIYPLFFRILKVETVMSHHDYSRKEKSEDDDDDEHDPVEEMIKKTGEIIFFLRVNVVHHSNSTVSISLFGC